MDNIEEVKKILKPECYGIEHHRHPCPIPDWGACRKCTETAQQICQLIKLPEGEPPLLNGEDINGSPKLTRTYIEYFKKYSYTKANRAIQRDSDIKWMRGE